MLTVSWHQIENRLAVITKNYHACVIPKTAHLPFQGFSPIKSAIMENYAIWMIQILQWHL